MLTDGNLRPSGDDLVSDAELLERLRTGDQQAYITLWKRHIDASLRLASSLYPARADDLASESFLAVYEQVTTTDKGPTSAFRAYLFTVIRNLAMKWAKETSRVDIVAEIEEIDLEDGLQSVVREFEAAEMLAAFQQLPERWQRVLWLSEIERVPRPQIAAEFEIKPNAVSSLQRRARAGLRLEWLLQQVPRSLREDQSHVAGKLPSFVLGEVDTDGTVGIENHVSECRICADVLRDLKPLASRMNKTHMLTGGFAALAVILPSASPLSAGAAVGGAAIVAGTAAGISISGILTASSIGTLAIGGIFVAALLTSAPSVTKAEQGTAPEAGASSNVVTDAAGSQDPVPERGGMVRTRAQDRGLDVDTQVIDPEPPATGPAVDLDVDTQVVNPEPPATGRAVETGRHNGDKTIDALDFSRAPSPDLRDIAPVPRPKDPSTVPQPNRELPPASGPKDPATPPESNADGNSLVPRITTPSSHSGHLAPVLTGTTAPGAQVAVETQDQLYLATVEDDGAWTFDLRPFDRVAGTYDYRVWAYTDTEQSTKVSGTYTLLPVSVQGFEGNPTLDISEALDTGIVMSVSGPANGRICLDSMGGVNLSRSTWTLRAKQYVVFACIPMVSTSSIFDLAPLSIVVPILKPSLRSMTLKSCSILGVQILPI